MEKLHTSSQDALIINVVEIFSSNPPFKQNHPPHLTTSYTPGKNLDSFWCASSGKTTYPTDAVFWTLPFQLVTLKVEDLLPVHFASRPAKWRQGRQGKGAGIRGLWGKRRPEDRHTGSLGGVGWKDLVKEVQLQRHDQMAPVFFVFVCMEEFDTSLHTAEWRLPRASTHPVPASQRTLFKSLKWH